VGECVWVCEFVVLLSDLASYLRYSIIHTHTHTHSWVFSLLSLFCMPCVAAQKSDSLMKNKYWLANTVWVINKVRQPNMLVHPHTHTHTHTMCMYIHTHMLCDTNTLYAPTIYVLDATVFLLPTQIVFFGHCATFHLLLLHYYSFYYHML
jgi:hypothetical protein